MALQGPQGEGAKPSLRGGKADEAIQGQEERLDYFAFGSQ
jgi:hypothetical protein